VKVAKINEDEQLVFAWANIAKTAAGELVVDSHDEVIYPEDLELAAYEYVLQFSDMGVDHIGEAQGHLVESLMLTKEKAAAMGISGPVPEGWWVGYHIPDPDLFAKVKSGEYPMMSIQGVAEAQEI